MRILKRIFIGSATRQIIDNIATHTGYPQTKNGLKELGFSLKDIEKALVSKYIDEYNFPVASFGDGDDITYPALKLTGYGKNIAKTSKKNYEIRANLFWWAMGIVSSVIAGLILTYVFGVGK